MAMTNGLLSAAEEQQLARRIESGVIAAAAQADELRVAASAQELDLLVGQGRLAWEQFLLANQRMVAMVAGRWRGRTPVSQEDLRQEGNVSLARALQVYDHRRGRFSTFALPRITFDIAQLAGTGDLGIPAGRARAARRLRALADELRQHWHREPTSHELAHAAQLSPGSVAALMAHRPPVGLDQVGEHWAATGPSGPDRLERAELRRAVGRLPGPLARVVELRFGLVGETHRSYRAVAEQLGISASTVRRMESTALTTLRAATADTELAG